MGLFSSRTRVQVRESMSLHITLPNPWSLDLSSHKPSSPSLLVGKLPRREVGGQDAPARSPRGMGAKMDVRSDCPSLADLSHHFFTKPCALSAISSSSTSSQVEPSCHVVGFQQDRLTFMGIKDEDKMQLGLDHIAVVGGGGFHDRRDNCSSRLSSRPFEARRTAKRAGTNPVAAASRSTAYATQEAAMERRSSPTLKEANLGYSDHRDRDP